MDLGREILRDRLFFRKELRERVYWFIRLRWGAVALGAVGLALAQWAGLDPPLKPGAVILALLALFNLGFLAAGRRLEHLEPTRPGPFEIFAHIQITLDLIFLLLLIYFTGGPASPLLSFTLLHVVLAGILLAPGSAYAYGLMVAAGLGLMVRLDVRGFTPPWPLPEPISHGFGLVALAGTLLLAAFLVTSIKRALRTKGRDLIRVSHQLELINAQLESLYDMIQDMSRQTKPQDLMDAAVRNGARIMGVLACSIKLLDETGGRLRYAATYGLSPKYLAKGWIHVDQSPINRRILEGSRYIIAGVDETGEFQYPDDLKNEGIKAMLCLPLRVESKTLGVFCVYGGLDAELTEDHARFFGQMTDLTALAIERLNRETAKTWFMNKTAHQLRSPLAAVMGMIGLFEKGFLGPMTDPQRETLERCRIRLNLLVETVNDLLILAAERDAAISEEEAQGFDPARSLSALLMVHQAQAETKGLSFHARIVDRPAKIQGGRRSFEDLASNLVANAVKYTHPPGRVEVTLDNGPPGFVVLTVRDTGIGIPDEDRGRLFTEFFRGENARAVTEEGTGLGLVIAQRALERLGGVMDIQSALGRGATITCRLPAK